MKKLISAEGVTEYPPGPQLAALTARFDRSGAVMLLLDVSGSMAGEPLRMAVLGCEGFLNEAVAGGYQVGLILWSTDVVGFEAPTADGIPARALLRRARVQGGTDIVSSLDRAGACLLALDVFDRVIAVFGDGDLGNAAQAKARAKVLAKSGVRILTLGLGAASAAALNAISTEQHGAPRSTTSEKMADDIRGLAQGLAARRGRS